MVQSTRHFVLLYLSRLHKINTYVGNKAGTKQFPRKAKAVPKAK
jgi:hypothetical protein